MPVLLPARVGVPLTNRLHRSKNDVQGNLFLLYSDLFRLRCLQTKGHKLIKCGKLNFYVMHIIM